MATRLPTSLPPVRAGWDCGSSENKGNILAYSLICLAIRSSLVCVLTESALLGRLLGAGVGSLFQLIGLALRFLEFGALLCHAHSLTQAGEIG